MNSLQQINQLTPFDDLFNYYGGHKKQLFKIYNDGSHFVGSLISTNEKKLPVKRKRHLKTDLGVFFDDIYTLAMQENLRNKDLFNFIKSAFTDNFDEVDGLDNFIKLNIKRKISNFYHRLKTFKRKAQLNTWTHFVTITFDDKKCTASSFRVKLKKCLSNLHTRRGWKYMGVFELSPKEKRLHFHALMYIPAGEMIGSIEERKDYSTKQHCMQTTHINSFFEKTFGRNDFEELSQLDLKSGKAINYIIKYLAKTCEKIVYSRGIPTEIKKFIAFNDIVCTMFDFVQKFIFYDDVITDDDINYPLIA